MVETAKDSVVNKKKRDPPIAALVHTTVGYADRGLPPLATNSVAPAREPFGLLGWRTM